jgi:peptidylprolyl isomerase/peptidyl-prolyl cis-trans isomerase B (cyclophilin B)
LRDFLKKEINMQNWKRIVLWVVVAGLVLSVAVCQKKTQQEKPSAAPPKEAELSSAPEEAAKPEEEPKPEEKPVEAEAPKEEEPAPAEEKPETTAPEESEMKETEKPAEAAPPKEITRDNAAAIIELAKGGRIVMEFYPKDAPNTVDNFIKLAKKGFYDGLTFHRVVPGFVVQGGDPLGNGRGGPGYTIKAEFNSRKHLTGTLAMARSTDPDSAGSQFYICLEPQPGLDGQYTVFGQVIEGMDLVKGIAKGDVMKKVTIVDKATVK